MINKKTQQISSSSIPSIINLASMGFVQMRQCLELVSQGLRETGIFPSHDTVGEPVANQSFRSN